MPHFYRSPDEFLAAARAAVAAAAPKSPVAVLLGVVDPVDGDSASPASRLAAVAEVTRHLLRGDDHVGLVDGRLVVLLVGATAEDGRAVGEHICAAVRVHAFGDRLGQLTLSAGSASAPEHGHEFDGVFGAANAALARIQTHGGDGTGAAPLPHHEALHRPLAVDRLAGRSDELASLIGWLDEACAGQPRVVVVHGESGTGTGTLLRQLEPEIRQRGGLFAMAASSKLDVPQPYGVWCALLKATQRFPSAPRRDWQELQHLEASFGPPADPSNTTGSQYRLLGELTEFVRALSSKRPLVVVLDEMQWADSTSWDALEHLLTQLDTDRIMVCLALRPDSTTEGTPHRQMLARHEIVREVTLSRLTRDEVKQWLEAAFHRQQVGREFLAFLYRHTEGNPLFITQLLRSLAEDGAIWYSGSRWEWRPVSELRLPAGRRELIAERLSRFSSSTQAVLASAAIIGREFDVALLVGAGAGSEPAVRLAMSEAVNAGLLRPTYERKQGGYAFAHDEIADVLVESIPRDRARHLHERIAQSFERHSPYRTGEIALHFDAAGEAADAYRWAQAAAKAAERVYAPSSAGAYLHVAARNATTPAELAEIRVALAHVAETGGRFDEVEELCDLAIEWFERQADERRALTIRRMRERARMELGQPARVTLDALIGLDAEAQRLGFARERIALLMMSSHTYGRLGDQRTAVRMANECIAMAEQIDDPSSLADALTRLGSALFAERPEEARDAYARALDLYEAAGDVRNQARGYSNLGIAAMLGSRIDEAEQAFIRGIAVARGAGIPDAWGMATLNLAVLYQRSGDYDRARDLCGEALALLAAVKHSEYQLAALYNMAHVERELGLWESAAELYDATIPLAQRIGQSDIEIGAAAGAGLCFLELDRVDEARNASAEAQSRMQSRPDWFQGRELVEALAVRIDARDGNLAEAVGRFNRAFVLAERADLYIAAWLTAACADALRGFDTEGFRANIERYSARVRELGYPEMTRRYEALVKA